VIYSHKWTSLNRWAKPFLTSFSYWRNSIISSTYTIKWLWFVYKLVSLVSTLIDIVLFTILSNNSRQMP